MKRRKPEPPIIPEEHCERCKRMFPHGQCRNVELDGQFLVLCPDCRMRAGR